MDHASKREERQNQGRGIILGQGWRGPVYRPTDLRRVDGGTLIWTLIRYLVTRLRKKDSQILQTGGGECETLFIKRVMMLSSDKTF